jgi:phenylpropionate dioxygenase-like ring-hydroxylating dioxygenase large terminal subunit
MTADSVARGQGFYQGLLDKESRPVPPTLRVTSAGSLEPAQIPPSCYFDPGFHRLEVERVWSRVWQMACREEQIPGAGDSIVFEIGDASLIIVRNDDDAIHAFHNSCLHRGTQLRTKPGHVRQFRCPFHGFTWNIDGSLREIPCAWDFPDIDQETFNLPQAQVGTWGGFVFINLDPAAAPLSEYLQDLPAHFDAWPLEERYLAAHAVQVLPCNWKVALEAFIEAYHTMAVHPQLLRTAADSLSEYDVYGSHVSRMITAVGVASEHLDDVEDAEILKAMLGERADLTIPAGQNPREVLGDRVRASLRARTGRDYSQLSDAEALDGIEYFLFPNFMPWAGFLTPFAYRFRPNGHDPDSCVMDIMKLEPTPEGEPRPAPAPTRYLGPGEDWADVPEFGALGRVFNQDTARFERIQKGLRASVQSALTLSRYQESRIRHFHATLESYLAQPPQQP